MKTILFVCTGNTCRSSMAEAMFKEMIKNIKDVELNILSAGTWALEGNKASSNAVEVMKEKNIDLSNHRSTPLTEDSVKNADLILTMTRNHKMQIMEADPHIKDKIYTLKEFAELDSMDIVDPFGGNINVYRECAVEIEKALRIVIQKIIKKANS